LFRANRGNLGAAVLARRQAKASPRPNLTDLLCAAAGVRALERGIAHPPGLVTATTAPGAAKEAAMTVHQKFGPPAYEFHPELGYLCPSRQLRQNVRVGLAAAAFGLIAGVAATATLLPRHGSDLTPTEPALAATAKSIGDTTPLVAPSAAIISPRVPAGSVERGAIKPPPPAAAAKLGTEPTFSPNAAPPVVETPAAPVVTTDRGTAAVGASEPVRAGASKRTRTAHSVARRRYREPTPTDAFATSPFGLQTSRFADETRSGRSGRRSGWGWGGDWRW
jgi:hypothetical protein